MAPGRKPNRTIPQGRIINPPGEGSVKGGRKAPRSHPDIPVSVKVQNKDPFTGTEHYKEDVRGKEYPSIEDEDWEFTTTWEIGDEVRSYPETVNKWCKLWFGKLPPGRAGGKRRGYRIPIEYRFVAKAWKQIEEPRQRELVRWALVDDLKDYVVLCGNTASCHYTAGEVEDRLQQLLGNAMMSRQLIVVVYVGPIERQANGTIKPWKKTSSGYPAPRKPNVKGRPRNIEPKRITPTYTKR